MLSGRVGAALSSWAWAVDSVAGEVWWYPVMSWERGKVLTAPETPSDLSVYKVQVTPGGKQTGWRVYGDVHTPEHRMGS